MRYYVRLSEFGAVIGYPQVLSNNPSDSPNEQWSDEQLKKNGIIIVDIDCDDMIERIDFDHPIIDNGKVTYNTVPLDNSDFNKKQLEAREAEYPSVKDKTDAMWQMMVEGHPDACDVIQIKIHEVDKKYPLK